MCHTDIETDLQPPSCQSHRATDQLLTLWQPPVGSVAHKKASHYTEI